jgi:hypothetical protein
MTLNEARAFALSLPEVTEEPHFEKASFRIRGKIFATVPQGDDYLNIFVDEDETRASVADDAAAFEELWWGKQLSGVRVNLRAANSKRVFHLLEEAWRRKAPKRVIEAHAAHRRR